MIRRVVSLGLFLFAALIARPCLAQTSNDLDHDGIYDWVEQLIAESKFPIVRGALSTPQELCPHPVPHPVLFRVRPLRFGGVADYDRLAVTYVILYSRDCGYAGHIGDAEGFTLFLRRDFGATPDGYRVDAVYAIAHRGAFLTENKSHSLRAFNIPYTPQVWLSTNKHGTYASHSDCNVTDDCSNDYVTDPFVFLNVGESWAHLSDRVADVALKAGADFHYFDTHVTLIRKDEVAGLD
jgi:hypothetical protein